MIHVAPAPARARPYIWAATITGLFCALAAALLLLDYSRRQAETPFDSLRFQELKQQLAASPKDEALKAEIRQLDLHLRQEYFRQRAFTRWGAHILAIGAVILFATAKLAATLSRRPPSPEPSSAPPPDELAAARHSRYAVAVLAALIGISVITLSLASPHPLAELPKTSAKTWSVSPKPPPAPTSPAAAWPRFRGPGGLGIYPTSDAPTSWNETARKNILWKTPVPLPGTNSPVIWADRLFLSGADETQRAVYCFDALTGTLLWQQPVATSAAEPPEVSEQTGYAAPTMTVDADRAYAVFATGDVAAFTHDGQPAWTRSLGVPKNAYGHAASLELDGNRLIIQLDQGDVKDGLSKLLALNTATGETVWETKRDVPNSWPSPILIEAAGQRQLITSAAPWAIAYDPGTGKEIWRAKCLQQDVGPSPTFADGLVYAANEWPGTSAIKPDGQGDVTATHVLWTIEDNQPDTASPVATPEFLFTVSSYGILTCFDAKSGEMLWEKEFDGAACTSSPTLAGGRLYVLGELDVDSPGGEPAKQCHAWIIAPSRTGGELVGEGTIDEGCVTSPAFQAGRIYLRGTKHLYCIGTP